MFPEESDKVERYVGGLPDMIQGSVVASKPKTMQEATKMASKPMDKKINTIAERIQAEPTLQDLVIRTSMEDLNLNVPNAITTITVHVLQNATSATNLVTWGVIVEVLQVLMRVRNANAPVKVYAVGHAGTNQDSNVVTDTFLLNNRYASILFDTDDDRSFVSTAFSS
ncbi:hypothetical protein Tco_0512007 [Tanacetum coccineum]